MTNKYYHLARGIVVKYFVGTKHWNEKEISQKYKKFENAETGNKKLGQ